MEDEQIEEVAEDDIDQAKVEESAHVVMWPGLDEEPETDPELEEEIDQLAWDIVSEDSN